MGFDITITLPHGISLRVDSKTHITIFLKVLNLSPKYPLLISLYILDTNTMKL